MKFEIKNPKDNILSLARKSGYFPKRSLDQETSFVRQLLGRDYPRFHLYIKESKDKNIFLFNLHLDQKKPSYEGSRAHSGEYEGGLVEKEVERIKKIISE